MRIASLILLAAALLAPPLPAFASEVKVIHSFCALKNCRDGYDINGGVSMDAGGNLYGVTAFGGKYNNGTIYELAKGADDTWTYSVLYDFCAQEMCKDGKQPIAPPVIDGDGNLYGGTLWGGNEDDDIHLGHGVLYQLTHNKDRTRWHLNVLHTFCEKGDCASGERAQTSFTYAGQRAGALYDGVSALYGTTTLGGDHGMGTVIQLVQKNGKWRESVLYSFCQTFDVVCRDGFEPGRGGTLLMDDRGNLFGTTTFGGHGDGIPGFGTAFELSPQGDGGWKHSVLYEFCSRPRCHDGIHPYGALIMAANGDLIGTASSRGSYSQSSGEIFRLRKDGDVWEQKPLYIFCQEGGFDCTDGAIPQAGVVMDASGRLFGTTVYGGGYDNDQFGVGGGALFELDGKHYAKLHSFCSEGGIGCFDGVWPFAALLAAPGGKYYGTTELGGQNYGGAIYEFTP